MAQRTGSAGVRASRVQPLSRNPRRTSTSPRTRNEVGRRLTGYVLRFAVNRIVEQRRHRNDEPGHSSAHGAGSAMGHAVTNALLEELIQEVIEFIVRHNFFLGNNNNKPPASDGGRENPDAGDSQQREEPSQGARNPASQEEERRRRRRHHRRNEAMMNSLDRLSDELEATYDATVRVLRESAGDGSQTSGDQKKDDDDNKGLPLAAPKITDESLRANLENLRRATTRCMARVESVRRSQHGSRRASRQRRAERSFNLSRAGSAMTGT